MPGIRENRLTRRKSQRSFISDEPAEIASLRRQPTEQLRTTSTGNQSGPSRRNGSLGGQVKARKSQRSHAAYSVREATLKLTAHVSSKVVSPPTISGKGLPRPPKTLSAPGTTQPKKMATKLKSLKSVPAVSKRLSNGPSAPIMTKAQKVSSDTKSMGMTKKSSVAANTSTAGQAVTKPNKSGKQLWFPGKAFLAVRAPDDDQFYLCRSRTRVFNTTRQFPITWLTLRSRRPQVGSRSQTAPLEYRISYRDTVNSTAILMEVSLNRASRLVYSLPRDQQTEIERLVRLAQAVEQGDVSISNIGDDVEKVVLIDEPPPKKPRIQKSASEKLKSKAKKTHKKPGSTAKPVKASKKTAKEKAEPKRKKPTKKEFALELHPRDDIVVLEKDPLFETTCEVPYVSKVANSRLIFRAIYLKNNKKLTKLLKDGSFIYKLSTKSVDNPETPYKAALKTKDTSILETMLHECLGTKFDDRLENNSFDPCRIDKLSTGSYNQRSLGVRFIRKITASRGSREGNNALTVRELFLRSHRHTVINSLVMMGPNDAQLSIMEKLCKTNIFENILNVRDICDLLLVGQYQSAGRIIEGDIKRCGTRTSFNHLMRDVLLFTNADLANCPPYACKHFSKRVDRLSPYHCAAANPNSKYLAKLLSVQPDIHVSDAKGRRPIHYAAGCSSPDPLKVLLDWGANVSDTDSTRRIPLHYAVEADRPENVKLLLEHKMKDGAQDLFVEKFGVGGVMRQTTNSLTPLHHAARHGFLEVAELLIKHGADINAKLSVTANQHSPLMLAAASGHLSMARLLVKHGAVVEQQDRMGLTALTHACKNGATSVLTYFLRLGSCADRADNSGNTPLHYAAAYGWLLTLRTLLDAGVNPNVHNMWRTTPVSVAYLKSHIGIVQELLAHGKVDINFTDDDGMTLLFHACSSDLAQKNLCEEITYMVEEKGASCDILDNMGCSMLHHLTRAVATIDTDEEKERRQALLQSVDIARILIKHGCPLNAVDQDGQTAAMTAVSQGHNYPLVEFLLSVGGKIIAQPAALGECPPTTMMHHLAKNIWRAAGNLSALVTLLKDKKHRDQVVKMCGQVDSDGFTPLLQACLSARTGSESNYKSIHGVKQLSLVAVFTANSSQSNYLHQSQLRINPWIPVREFIRTLVTAFKADPNAKMAKKYFDLDDMPRPKSQDWWLRQDLAEKTPAHIVLFQEDPDWTVEANANDIPKLKSRHAGFMFRDLVTLGADLNVYDLHGISPLGSCITENRHDLLQFLQLKSSCDFNMPIKVLKAKKDEHIHPILYASSRANAGCATMINGLIDCGANVNATMSDSIMKCLHVLVAHGNQEIQEDILKIVDKLAEKGYDFNSKDGEGRTALHYSVRSHTGNMAASMELEVKLLQLGTDPGLQDNLGRTALHYIFKAIQPQYGFGRFNQSSRGDPAEMTQLISRNMRKEQMNLQDKHGKTALHFAAEQGAAICCMYLTMVGVDSNIKDNDGNTALALAVQNKFDGCASNLIQGGSSLKSKVIAFSAKELKRRKKLEDKKDPSEEEEDSPLERWLWQPARLVKEEEAVKEVQLYQAAVENNLNGVAMFITGADVHSSGLNMLDAIQITFRTCMYQTGLRLLHTNTDLSVLHKPLDCGRTMLHALALSCENNKNRQDPTLLKLAELLINSGLRPDALDKFGCSPAQYAILHRHFGLADFLAEQSGGYDVNYHDNMGRSHLAAVFWRAHSIGLGGADTWNFLKKLIDKKIDLDQLFDLPLNTELIKLNVQQQQNKLDPDYFSKYPRNRTTALIVAISCGLFTLSKDLLTCGANPNTSDGSGLSPLMNAIKMNDVNFVKLLLDYDFNPNKREDLAKVTKAKQWNNVNGTFNMKYAKTIGFNDDSEDSEDESSEEEEEQPNHPTKLRKKANEPEFLPLKQTSPVKLDQKDRDGRTALHYVASPHSEGTFNNGEMASLLLQNGCTLQRSKSGLNAYQEAVEAGAAIVARLVKAKFKLPAGGSKPLSDGHQTEPVNDGVPPIVRAWPDVNQASHQVLRRYTSDQKNPTYVHTVDPNCQVQNGELVKDEELDRYYDVLMTKVDVKRGDWGLYNFYQIQLVYQPIKNLYILFTRWGRIEDDGQFQHTPFTEREAAVKEFAKVFREKSGNKWTEIDKYEQKPKKYRLVEDVARQAPPPQKDVDIDLSSGVVSLLPKHLAKVVKTLMNPEAMQNSMKHTRGLDTHSLPFGQLNKERLMQGQRLLQQIEKHVDDVEAYRANGKKTIEDTKAYQKSLEMIADLSNDYYHVIPQSNFSCEKLRPLDKKIRLTTQMYNLSNLLHYQAACKLVLAAMWHKHEYNPVDFVYRSMGCKIQLMDQSDLMVQMILKYIHSYEDNNHNVQAIFRVERKEEKDRQASARTHGEHRLLWHGSSTCNILSILHRGLLVSPPEFDYPGSRFGKGIYFSDAFSFSANYAHSSKTKFMLLCEVAMGEVIDHYKELEEELEIHTLHTNTSFTRNQKTADTIMVTGNYYYSSSDWLILPSGVRLPMGKRKRQVNRAGTSHTQYVVRDPAAVTLRYLIQFS